MKTIKLLKSWKGKAPGRIIQVTEKEYDIAIKEKIGEVYVEPKKPVKRPVKKQVKPEYENKEEKQAPKRRKKKAEEPKSE